MWRLVCFTNSSTDSDEKQTAWREKYGGLLLAGRWKQVYSLNKIPPVRVEGSDARCGTDRRRALEYLRGFYLIYYDSSLHPTDMKWWEQGKNRAKNVSERTRQLCQIKGTLEPVRVVINSLHMSLCMMLLKRQLRCYLLSNVAVNPIPVANLMSVA